MIAAGDIKRWLVIKSIILSDMAVMIIMMMIITMIREQYSRATINDHNVVTGYSCRI